MVSQNKRKPHTLDGPVGGIHEPFYDIFHTPPKILNIVRSVQPCMVVHERTGSLPRNSRGRHKMILSISSYMNMNGGSW